MDTNMVHNGVSIALDMNRAPTQLKDGTWLHYATIRNFVRLADLDKLIGLELWGEKVTGVAPEHAIDKQFGQTVGLVMKSKKWEGK